MSATLWIVRVGSRGSSTQAASRPATSSRRSTSRRLTSPASEDSDPPSKRADTVLPFTGDRPGSGGVVCFMAGGVLPTCEFWRRQPKLYRKSEAWTTSASLDAYFGLGSWSVTPSCAGMRVTRLQRWPLQARPRRMLGGRHAMPHQRPPTTLAATGLSLEGGKLRAAVCQ